MMGMKAARLLEVRSQGSVRGYVLNGQPVTLGRAADNAVILEDVKVSRYHACIEWTGAQAYLTDRGSANGSAINGSSIAPNVQHPINPGDTISIGDFQLSLKEPGAGQIARIDSSLQPFANDAAALLTRAEPAKVVLVVTTPQGSQEHVVEERAVSIGRDASNDIRIDHPVVSRHHARLEQVAHGYELIDLGSTNGLMYQGSEISRLLVADGDVIGIAGDITLAFEIEPLPAEDSTTAMSAFQEAVPAEVVREPPPEQVEPVGATIVGMEEPVAGLQKIDLRQRSTLTIGRGPDNDVQLKYPTISRHHARITRVGKGQQYAIEDLTSSNGTLVNDELIRPGQPFPLHPGNTIRIGPVKFLFAPEAMQLAESTFDLRLDALHLNQWVGKDVNLLKDISLSVLPREFVAVVGVSGAGKSTLLNALAGIRPASDGAVLVNGTNLYQYFNAFRTDLGYVPQDDIIHKELSAEKALDYAARLRLPGDTGKEERRQAVVEELQTLGLLERRDVRVGSLSGGQRKRVSIGVERLTRPRLFFLDEATSGLDPGTENQLMRLLRQLADAGQTILLITHATKNVMLCDQVVFLAKGGRLAYFGPPDQALEYFGVQDFDEIYEKLQGERSPEEWAERYRRSPQYHTYVVERLQEQYGELLEVRPAPPAERSGAGGRQGSSTGGKAKVKQPSSFRHLSVLTARYLDIIRSDRANLLLMLMIAPILASMDLIAWPREIFSPVVGDASRAMVMLFLAAIIPFLVGALSSVREIVKEKAIYQRERTVNLRIVPYLSSKVVVGILFALYHAAALLVLKLVAVDFSHLGTADLGLYGLILVLAVLSGVMWGLLISALVPREEQAMLLVIIVVVVQMVFSGGILSLDQLGKAGEVLGYATSSKWTYEALVDIAQVKRGECGGPTLENCQLSGIQAYDTDAERRVVLDHLESRYGDVLEGDFKTAIVAQVGIMAVLFVLLALLQKRKDLI
jgi:ABC-type multidrug transport system ATPase subunit/pSer/pThr/pTyr-binding forkhead associated (FHA) protein